MSNILNNIDLVNKYDVYADDYTDYPHKSNWLKSIGDKEYRNALKTYFKDKSKAPTLLYIHIPFCKKMCYFCICHKEITSDYNRIADHFNNNLSLELTLLHQFFEKNLLQPNFKEIYLGGGSPTLLRQREFDKLIKLFDKFIDIKKLNRFCVEIDPRTCSPDKLRYYHEKGVTTLSIGVQDIDIKVQKAVNRIQPFELVERLLTPDIRKKFTSINFDFLVGLPLQTEESMRKTMEKAITLSPDRISLCHHHYTIKFYPHMKVIKKLRPAFLERKRIFAAGLKVILDNNYIRTGFEHFAKPDDIVAKAVGRKNVTYTSLGAISKDYLNVLAVGRSGHGIIGNDYLFQNHYKQKQYAKALSKGKFPIYRGLKLSVDDAVRRYIIRELRTYFVIEILYIENWLGRSFKRYFKKELSILNELVKDKLVIVTDREVRITENGKHFTDFIISIFDKYLKSNKYYTSC